MALTIPRAGTVAGRSAGQQIAGSESGSAAAALGERMMQAGLQWKAQQRDRALKQAQLDITRDMGAARLDVEQIGDPDQIGPAWDARVAEIRARYASEGLDAETADGIGMIVQGLGDRHALDMSQKVVGLRQSQQVAQWIDTRHTITTTGAKADPVTMEEMIAIGEREIDDQVAKSILTPAQAAEEKQKLRAEISGARATEAIDTDPEGFLTAAGSGAYDALPAGEKARLEGAARTEIARRAAADQRAAEAAGKEAQKLVDGRVSTIGDLASAGRLVIDEGFLESDAAKASPHWPEAMAAVALRNEIPDIQQKSVKDLDALIEAEKKRPVKEVWENKRLTVMTAWRDKKAAQVAQDPVKAATASGLPVPQLPDFDAEDPAGFIQGLARRGAFAATAVDDGQMEHEVLFSEAEKAKLKAIADPKAPVDQRLALVDAILRGTGGKPATVLKELGGDPTFARATKLLATTGNDTLVSTILRGQQKIAEKVVILPPPKEQKLIVDSVLKGLLGDNPALKAEITETALAIFADEAAGIDAETQSTEGWIADGEAYTLFTSAVQRSLGASTDRNGNLTTGGLQEVNGAPVILPPGVSRQSADDALDWVGRQLQGGSFTPHADPSWPGRWSYDDPEHSKPEQMFRALQAASIDGRIPDLGRDPSAFFSGLTLHRVGESDVYELHRELNGRSVPVGDADRVAYRFNLKALIRETGK